ncbi:MAG: hypothetical protein U9R34_07450 [Nanoarchaeota archaeon]|nr:hypothetical protein [Nanoarchaeota archaeon]
MEKNSKVICDSNICVYRTLAVIEPKVYLPVLSITQKYLNEITKKKINYQSTENERIKKLGQRPNNLPERPDRKILAEAIELKRHFPEINNCILTNDTDFIEFRNEIKKKFGINIEHIPKN